MNQDPLDPLLGDYARRSLPRCPAEIGSDVWREIEQRRRRSFWSRVVPLFEWRELFAEPRLALAAFACALAAGVLPAALAVKSHADQQLARRSFHFEVFSTNSPNSLSALVLAHAAPDHATHR